MNQTRFNASLKEINIMGLTAVSSIARMKQPVVSFVFTLKISSILQNVTPNLKAVYFFPLPPSDFTGRAMMHLPIENLDRQYVALAEDIIVDLTF